jgi:hypothetical protein
MRVDSLLQKCFYHAIAQQWSPVLVTLFRLSTVMSQYSKLLIILMHPVKSVNDIFQTNLLEALEGRKI